MRHLDRYIVLTTLLLSTLTTEAVQLGSVKGSAVFGRPLDLSVLARLEAPHEEAADCFSAEVFQADNKFDSGRVRIDVVTAVNGMDATIRIRSATAVDEPWAKVILHSNCGAKVSRQYDFLTDFATDISTGNMLAETTPNLPATATNSSSATAAVIAQAKISNLNVRRSQARVKASQQVPNTQNRSTQKRATPIESISMVAASASKKATALAADAVGQSRLKMETFELTDEHQVLLKLSTALIAPTGMRTPEEIQALAQATAVWRAINGMSPEIKATETPAAHVLTAAQVNPPTEVIPPVAMPTQMKQKLAGKSEFSNLIVYGLIGLLALALGCIVWLWLRVRKATHAGYVWLNDSVPEDEVANNEPAQFLHSEFYETKGTALETPKPTLDVEAEPETEQDAISEVAELKVKIRPVATPLRETPVVHSFPAHFDDPRFDERVLRVKKKDRNLTHEKPITSSVELIDLVIADTPPKPRSFAAPSLESLDLPIVTNVSKATKAKDVRDDPKGSLIDFDVFAYPEPLNKPTRFVR